MRCFLYFILSLFICQASISQVVINEVYVFGQNYRTTEERFIELRNTGSFNQDLAGYSICLSNDYGEEKCDFIQNDRLNATMIKSSQRKIIKINRREHVDNLLYMNLDCEEVSTASLYDHQGHLIDQIEFKDLRNKKSIFRIESETNQWAYGKPTKKKKNQTPEKDMTPMTYELDSISNKVLSLEARDTNLIGLVKINEVFFISKPDGFINKDFWVELVNVSDQLVDLSTLVLTTDPEAEVDSIKDVDARVNDFLLRPNHFVGVSIDDNYFLRKTPLTCQVKDSSSTIYLMQNGAVIDSLTVPPLTRVQSFGRYPDGNSRTRVLMRQTVGKSNNQIFPGEFSTPSWMLIHTVGVNVSDYNTMGREKDSRYRPGAVGSIGAQVQLRNLISRHYLSLKRQSFRINSDSVITTNFGRGVRKVRGFQRMSYLSAKTEYGYPIVPKLNLFLGMEFDLLIDQIAERRITNQVEITGEAPTIESNSDSEFQILSDPIDLNVHLAIEYQIAPQVFLNLSYHQDFLSLASQGSSDRILTRNVRFQFVIPIYKSNRLKEKSYLFYD